MVNNRSNQYFETPTGIPGEFNEEVMVARMAECTIILNDLNKSEAWRILLDDVRHLIQSLDDKWQELPLESPQLKEARCVKMAFKHISDLPGKYLEELNMIEEKLKQVRNPDGEVIKDADNN